MVGEEAKVNYSIIDRDVKIGKNARVGVEKENSGGITVIGARVNISDGVRIADKKMISAIKEDR